MMADAPAPLSLSVVADRPSAFDAAGDDVAPDRDDDAAGRPDDYTVDELAFTATLGTDASAARAERVLHSAF